MKPNSSPLTICVFLFLMVILATLMVMQFVFDALQTVRLLLLIKVKREFNLQRQGALFRLVPGTSMGSARIYMWIHGYKHASKEEFSEFEQRVLVCIPSKIKGVVTISRHDYSYFKPMFE